MTFARIWPAGVAAAQVIEPIELETLDIDHSKAINGVDGDIAAGALELSDCDLTGTSSIDITGDIHTTGFVDTDANLYVGQDADITGNLEVHGNDLIVDQSLTVTGSANIRYMYMRRIIPDLSGVGGVQTIDTSTATVLALDFTAYTDWLITLNNGADPALPAVLATIATLVDTHVDSERTSPPTTKFTITFRAGAAQTGGIGISPSVAVFPASFHGLTKADLVGPRSGANGVGGGTNDWMRIELENIGTTGTPRYSCSVTMGSG